MTCFVANCEEMYVSSGFKNSSPKRDGGFLVSSETPVSPRPARQRTPHSPQNMALEETN